MTMIFSYGKAGSMTSSTLTTKGQTTIPREVRQALQLKPGMRLMYEIERDHVALRPQPKLLDAFGSLKSKTAGMDFQKARETAARAWVRKASLKP